jgi:hypothetical protein
MRIIANIFILILIGFLAYLLYSSIREPISFGDEKAKREKAVVNKLKKVRNAQQFYKDITGMYASDFDTLAHVLRTGDFYEVRVSGNPDDPDADFELDTIYTPAYDTIQKLGWNLDSLKYVPFTEGVTFDIQADTIQYQQTKTAVVQVGVKREKFMGKYADPSFSKYDKRYDPSTMIKFGDMNKPSVAGNWE